MVFATSASETAGARVGFGREIAFSGIFPRSLLLAFREWEEKEPASVGDTIGGDGSEAVAGMFVIIFAVPARASLFLDFAGGCGTGFGAEGIGSVLRKVGSR